MASSANLFFVLQGKSFRVRLPGAEYFWPVVNPLFRNSLFRSGDYSPLNFFAYTPSDDGPDVRRKFLRAFDMVVSHRPDRLEKTRLNDVIHRCRAELLANHRADSGIKL